MKKSGIILLGAICLSLLGCNNGAKQGDQAKLFYAYSTENLLSDWDYFDAENEENEDYLHRDYKMRFNGVKNENLAAQLMIHANEHIDSFDFKLPELKSESGDTIPSSAMTVGAEWYQEVTASKEIEAYSGYYADAIIPLANYKFRRQDQILKGRNQGLWFNLFVDKDVKAGKYTGTGTLTLDDKNYDIPFEVNIYDATLPETNHLQTCFLIWYEQIVNGEGKNDSAELHQKYYDFLASKHISPGELPPEKQTSPEVYANYCYEIVAKDPKISGNRIPIFSTACTTSNVKAYFNSLINKAISVRESGDTTTNIFSKLILYVDDEPSPERYEVVKSHDKIIYDAKQELAPRLNAYPDLKESFLHIKNLCTVQYNDTLVGTETTGGVQTWCPQVQNFQTPSDREIYKQRMASNERVGGENVFWYVCEAPNNPYPNYHLDGKLLYTRTLKYMQYAYGIQGEVHWNICYYSKYFNGFTTGRDIWHDPLTWEKCNGDGAMVYPGRDYGIDGPITTLRLENICDANETYEYQWMINEKVQEYNAAHGTNYVTSELLSSYYAKMFNNMKTVCNDRTFDEVQVEILNLLQTLYTNLDAGMNMLIK